MAGKLSQLSGHPLGGAARTRQKTLSLFFEQTVSWTFSDIEREWLGGQKLELSPEDVESAFAAAEQVRGRDWVLRTGEILGGGRLLGFVPFLRVYAFGKRIQAIAGAPGREALLERLLRDDPSAQSELTAIYLLCARHKEIVLEIGAEVTAGGRHRRPDFQIRSKSAPWTFVEVTQLNRSTASARMQDVLHRIAGQVISIHQPFLLEIVFWREPTEGEDDELLRQVHNACHAADGEKQNVRDLASIMVKSGDPAVIVPSILPKDDGTRMSFAQSIVGPGEPNRQILVRAPFADQRAEDILKAEARQLPKDESGLVMVDVTAQPTAFESWAKLIPPRFTPVQHTRVGGVLLFMNATTLTPQGLKWVHYLKLIPNAHARIPLPAWITEVVEETRAESRRLTGYSG